MKTFYQFLLIILLSFTTSLSGYGNTGLCGNDSKNGRGSCTTSCKVGNCPKNAGDPKAGDPFEPYTGNAHREIRDLQVWGGVGEIPLVWMRYYNSRSGEMWNYSFHYQMYDGGVDSQGNPQLIIIYPEGGENVFTQDANDPTLWLPLPGIDKRLFQDSNNFFLQMANGHRYRFEKLKTSTGSIYYQLQDFRDSQQNLYTLTYNSDRLLTRITEPGGRYFKIDYTNISGVSVISQVTTSDGRSVRYNYDIFDDGVSKWIRFNSVDYGDGTKALYTYYQDQPGGLLSLEHAIDPRYEGVAGNMRFTYDYSIAPGFIKEEINGLTGAVTATLIPEPGIRKVCYPNGRVQTFVVPFGLLGRTTEYSDGLGQITKFDWDMEEKGFVRSETDKLGRVTVYNARTIYGNPLEITHPDGSREQWTRDELDLVLTYTDGLGRTTTYTRDEKHRVTGINYPDGSKEFFTYNNFGQVLTRTRRNGGVENYDYNGKGQLIGFTDALGNETGYTYNSAGLQASITDARKNTTQNEYNERGLLTKITFADGTSQLYTYDTFGNQTSVTNELGNTWSTLYDEFRRPKTETDPLNRVTQYSYELSDGGCGCAHDQNKPTGIILPSGTVTEIEYDVEWRVIRETLGAGTSEAASTFYEYDLMGNLQTIIDPDGKSQVMGYDARNRRISETDPLGLTTARSFDAAGNVIRETRPEGSFTENRYDPMDRLIETTDQKGQVTKMSYDAEGNLIELTDTKNRIYLFDYDLLNRKSKMVYPDGSGEEFDYDGVGNLKTYTTRAGQERTYTYDSRSREILSDWDDATPDVASTYDAAGRILTMNSSASTLSYTYNEANELESETQDVAGGSAKTVEYTYNPDGLRSTMVYPGGTEIIYNYTARNQIRSISEGGSFVANYSYDLNGNRTGKALQNGTSTSNTYDANHRLLSMIHQKAGVTFASLDYGYDNLNRRTFVKRENSMGDVYAYDATDQITNVQYETANPETAPDSPARTVSYNWDEMGNRTAVADNGTATGYTANNLNQYTSVGGSALSYTENGSLSTFDGWTYTYDSQDRLVKAQNTGTTMEFSYDARNRRVKLTADGTTDFFYYDFWNLIEDRSSDDALLERYVHGAQVDELMVKVSESNTVYYHHDGLGSVTHLTDAEGNVVERYSYDVFGAATLKDGSENTTDASAFQNRFLFTGREFIQQINLYDYRNRMYSPELGRFLQVDPIRFNSGDINLYRYVRNNPVSKKDPFGLEEHDGITPEVAKEIAKEIIKIVIISPVPLGEFVAALELAPIAVLTLLEVDLITRLKNCCIEHGAFSDECILLEQKLRKLRERIKQLK